MQQTTAVLTALHVYPLKSAGGIALSEGLVEQRGLQYDRRWMIVDEDRKFITQREVPRIALLKTGIAESCLLVSAPGLETLKIPLRGDGGKRVHVQVWSDYVKAIPYGKEIDEWFGTFLGFPCGLVLMPDDADRTVDGKYSPEPARVTFVDAFPFLLLTEASLEDLNGRLDAPLPMNRFRPNLVVSGCDSFDEDRWRTIQIGEIRFRVAKPCSRCATTTVDQATGIRGKEPLRTLATYREHDGEVYFGQNLIHEREGTIRVGTEVEILE